LINNGTLQAMYEPTFYDYISGTYVQNASATFATQINGDNGVGNITATGGITLSGTLHVDTISAPTVGVPNQILYSVNGISGTFSSTVFAGGYQYKVTYTSTTVYITLLLTPTSPTINNIPNPAVNGGSFTPNVVTTGDGATWVTSSTLSVCSLISGIVNFNAPGTCTLTAHVAVGADYAAADGNPQSFTVAGSGLPAPTTPTINNIPSGAVYGGSFTPNVVTTGDGTKSVTSSTTGTCTLSAGVVNYVGAGTCTLTAHVSAGDTYAAADGEAQSFTISKAPSVVFIGNIPTSGTYGGTYPASVVTFGGDGTVSATSSTPSVCTFANPPTLVVSYVGVGTCTLVADVTAGTDYQAADGTPQSFPVLQATPTAPTITNIPANAATGGSFTPTVATNGDGATSATSSTAGVCTVTAGVVSYVAVGTCTLTAHVAAGTNYTAADGNPQSFTVSPAVVTTVPSAPTSALAISGSGSATVCWTAPTNNGGSPITGYVIVSDPGHVTATASASAICATVSGLANGTSYTFTVAANNTVGAGQPSLPSNSVTPRAPGYWEVAQDGGMFTFGGLGFYGSMGGSHINQAVVGMVAAPDGQGYWEVAQDGGVFTFGDAGFYGSAVGSTHGVPVVGMAVTHDGQGYWLVTALGAVIPFGDAHNLGSMVGQRLNQPIVGMAPAPDGAGYWLVAADGGVFTFGSAAFAGSMGGTHLNQPVIGMAADPSSPGYWLVAADGGVFTFGGARYYGSLGGSHLAQPVVGLRPTPDGAGYWEDDAAGTIYTFGDAVGYGSMANRHLNLPMIGLG
jgi:hypothetical protein